jgi:hypothetical protein
MYENGTYIFSKCVEILHMSMGFMLFYCYGRGGGAVEQTYLPLRVSISTLIGYGLDGWGLIPGRGRFFPSPERLRPPSLLYNGYQWFFPQGKTERV